MLCIGSNEYSLSLFQLGLLVDSTVGRGGIIVGNTNLAAVPLLLALLIYRCLR